MDLDKLYAPTLRWVNTNPADIASMPDELFRELLRVASRQACKRVHYFARERGRRFDAVSPRAFIEELGVVDRWVTSALLADRGQRGWRCFRCKSWIKKSKRCDCGWNKPAPGAQWLEKVLHGVEDGQAFARNVHRRVGQDHDDALRRGPFEVAMQHANAAASSLGLERVETPEGNRVFDSSREGLPRELTAAEVDFVRSQVDKAALSCLKRAERSMALLQHFLELDLLLIPLRAVASLDVELFQTQLSAVELEDMVQSLRSLLLKG